MTTNETWRNRIKNCNNPEMKNLPRQQKAFLIYEDELENLIDSRFKKRINLYKAIRSRQISDEIKEQITRRDIPVSHQ